MKNGSVGSGRDSDRSVKSQVLFFGALWGIAEGTLGFALHALPRIVPLPNLAGAVMFPVALLVMIAAIRTTGRPAAALGAAVVAASIKASTAALPAVPLLFVRNPVMAILAEGAIVSVAASYWMGSARAVGIAAGMRSMPERTVASVAGWALAVSVGWRVLFLGMNFLLGIGDGILARPASAVTRFLVLESLWNAGLIVASVIALGRLRSIDATTRFQRYPLYPVAAPIALLFAIGLQWGSVFL